MSEFKTLQESADRNRKLYEFTKPNLHLLETFPAPYPAGKAQRPLKINIVASEFTSLCPITGQPDYGVIRIAYRPDEKCLESKSLKLYLMGFRMNGAFHETIVAQICYDLYKVLHPHEVEVFGDFVSRGGISFNPHYQLLRFPDTGFSGTENEQND